MAEFLSVWALTWKTINSFLLPYGLALYVIILPPLVKYRTTKELDHPFFRLVTSMAFFDLVGIIFKSISPIIDLVFWGQAWLMGLYGYVTYVSWWGVQLHQLLIAIDRYIAILHAIGVQHKVFGGSKLRKFLLIIWLASVVGNAHMFTKFGFTITTNATNLISSTQKYRFDLSDPDVQLVVLLRDMIIQCSIYVAIIGLYTASLVGIWGLKKRVASMGNQVDTYSRAQVSMAIQGMLVSAPQTLGVVFYFGSVLVPGRSQTAMLVMVEFFNTLYNCINPAVYLAFGSAFRAKVIKYYITGYSENKKKQQKNAVQPIDIG